MPIALSPNFTQINYTWTDWKTTYNHKGGSYQYQDDGITTTVWFYDTPEVHYTTIWDGTVPDSVIASGYSQNQNDADLSEFRDGWISGANKRINAPVTIDGRPNFAPQAFPPWSQLYFTGRGDDINNGIGQGPRFQMSSDAATPTDSQLQWSFTDPIFVLGGLLFFTGAILGDTIDYIVTAPATTTGVGSQSVILQNIGPGNIIVPVPSNGTTTIDTSNIVPIPNNGETGFWDYSDPNIGFGSVSPNFSQNGNCDLFDFTLTLGHLMVEMPLIGDNRSQEVVVESVTSMKLWPQWQHIATVHNGGHNGLRLAWSLFAARAKTV